MVFHDGIGRCDPILVVVIGIHFEDAVFHEQGEMPADGFLVIGDTNL